MKRCAVKVFSLALVLVPVLELPMPRLSPPVLLLAALSNALAATPAFALECTDIRALMTAEVEREVIQRIVYEAPPVDGWTCLEGSGLVLAHLNMGVFFARLDTREDLRWTTRKSACEAGAELRRGTRRLIERLERREDAPLDQPANAGPGSVECQKVSALREAIDARDLEDGLPSHL